MNTPRPYLVGFAQVLEAAGHEKTAISRWLAGKFGLGVGTAIDEAKEQAQKLRAPEGEPTELPTAEIPELEVTEPGEPLALPQPGAPVVGDGVIDTPEEVEEVIVKVLAEAGVGTP